MPAHAYRPISHAWLKNVSFSRLTQHNFQKYVNSDLFKARNPCVKWINDNTFLTISDFWSKKHWDWDWEMRGLFPLLDVFGRLRMSSEDFGRLRKTSDFFGSLRKWSCRLQKCQHSQDKNLTPLSQKKLAGIPSGVYFKLSNVLHCRNS